MTGRQKTEPVLQKLPFRTDVEKRLLRYLSEHPHTKLRSVTVAASGTLHMLSCDYSQMELRVLAQLGSIQRKS